jgi:dCTP deaminase
MIMGYSDLLNLWKKKIIRFDPDIDPQQIGLSSIDLRLGYLFTKQKDAKGYTVDPFEEDFDPTPIIETVDLMQQQRSIGQVPNFILKPNEFVLSRTLERITLPLGLAAQVQGTTTGARPGLSIHATAPHIHPAFSGSITLEIKNLGTWDLKLVPSKRICQVIFFRVQTPVSKKQVNAMSTYHNQVTPYGKRQVGVMKRQSN